MLAQALAAQVAAQAPHAGITPCVVNILDQKLQNPNPDYFSYTLTKAALQHMYKDDGTGNSRGGIVIYMGSVHSHEASKLKSAYVTAKGFVRTPLVEKQIPEQAKALGISEADVIKNVMLKDTVDGVFTTVDDIAQTALYLATFPSAALTGQSIVVSHGWYMQ